jgi:hypothetical protein
MMRFLLLVVTERRSLASYLGVSLLCRYLESSPLACYKPSSRILGHQLPVVDRHGTLVFANQTALDMFGVSDCCYSF